MSEPADLGEVHCRTLAWAQRAHAEHFLSSRDVDTLANLEERLPENLFETEQCRPLVAAFFGGTGVGKSTLLNRLAGEEIARTGVVRPTSHEISVYLHESVRLRPLPDELPMEKVRLAHHANEAYRNVLWVDMPDFDSTDRNNQALALDWLPHIDVVIYVVSPERYRDDRGWRLLLDHEREHAWLFVLNQWDRAHPVQLEDFRKLLCQGGFVDPIVLRTDSRVGVAAGKPDDFARFGVLIRGLAEQRTMEQLTRHNRRARWQRLGQAVASLLEKLGEQESFRRLDQAWRDLWAENSAKLRRGLQWPLQELAARFVRREGNPMQRSLNLEKAGSGATAALADGVAGNLLWDEWAQLCFEDSLDRLLVDCETLGLPSGPLAESLRPLRKSVGRLILDRAQTALRDALARPGNAGQRLLLKLSGLIAVLAPFSALCWVSYEVVMRYYQSVQTAKPFLGIDFAIHSGLLVGIAWLFPYFLHRQLRPSAERIARRGLEAGLGAALDQLETDVESRLQALRERAAVLRAAGRELIAGTEPPAAMDTRISGEGFDVNRLLANPGR